MNPNPPSAKNLYDDPNIRAACGACPELYDFSDAELQQLLSIAKLEVFHKDDMVFTIAHKEEKFFVVVEGRLLLRLRGRKSKEFCRGKLFGEVSILGDTHRTGAILATKDSMLISFNREDILHSEQISKELALKTILCLTKKMVTYLEDKAIAQNGSKLIEKGECDFIEFKRSANPRNNSIIRCIASFLNLNGGTILCGVDNNGDIVGIPLDLEQFDKLQMAFFKEIDQRLSAGARKYVHFDIEQIEGKNVLRIECETASRPIYYKDLDKNGKESELLLVRAGSENRNLSKPREIVTYVRGRF